MDAKTSRDSSEPRLRKDQARGTREAITEDADITERQDRDLVHGEGGTVGLSKSPRDLAKDD
jgi:hypothetical protein